MAGADAEPSSHVGRLAEAAARRSLASADAILLVVDLENEPRRVIEELRPTLPNRRVCICANKIDLLTPDQRAERIESLGMSDHVCPISALAGTGIGALRAWIGDALFGGGESHGSDILALSDRQRNALRDALSAIERAGNICAKPGGTTASAEFLAIELREAIDALSLLTGEVITEDLLDRIFSRFCIGK
jgi:tRNA modification GTPase